MAASPYEVEVALSCQCNTVRTFYFRNGADAQERFDKMCGLYFNSEFKRVDFRVCGKLVHRLARVDYDG